MIQVFRIIFFLFLFNTVRAITQEIVSQLSLLSYCASVIVVTITSHIFINIFQTVHFAAVKFTKGNEENNNELSSDTKISESLKKKI